MDKPINVLRGNLPGVAHVTYDLGKAQGKEGERLNVEYSQRFENAYGKLEEEPTMMVSSKEYIELRDKEGEIYRIDSVSGKPLIEKGQDEKKVVEIVKEFNEAIKEVGLKIFNEMLAERKHIQIGYDNTIDAEQVKLAVNAYLAEKEGKLMDNKEFLARKAQKEALEEEAR